MKGQSMLPNYNNQQSRYMATEYITTVVKHLRDHKRMAAKSVLAAGMEGLGMPRNRAGQLAGKVWSTLAKAVGKRLRGATRAKMPEIGLYDREALARMIGQIALGLGDNWAEEEPTLATAIRSAGLDVPSSDMGPAQVRVDWEAA